MKNITEILKDCPKGTKLYSPILGEVEYLEYGHDTIWVKRPSTRANYSFDQFGRYLNIEDSECVLFPSKDNRNWDKFRPFKDGDILVGNVGKPFIFNCTDGEKVFSHCGIDFSGRFWKASSNWTLVKSLRFATEEEKQQLFDTIKANGYKWNAETKTLEKLIVPKFKVGDRIQFNNERPIRIIKSLEYDRYRLDNGCYIKFGNEGAYKLLKFDISTLKPFDKVLVRDYNHHHWRCALYERYDNTRDIMYFATIIGHYQQCIPFEGNKHLLGTTNNCDEYYKNW